VAKAIERRFPGTVAVTEPSQAIKVDTSSRLIVDTGWIISLLALIVGGSRRVRLSRSLRIPRRGDGGGTDRDDDRGP
jgi:hypothetical protein